MIEGSPEFALIVEGLCPGAHLADDRNEHPLTVVEVGEERYGYCRCCEIGWRATSAFEQEGRRYAACIVSTFIGRYF